jgi:hydroxypyruvate isomerase
VTNLRFAARELKRRGIALMIEPLNAQDNPAFFIRTSRHAVEIIEEVGSDNLHLQFDVYHSRIMDDDVVSALQKNIRHIGHVQIADYPGRTSPVPAVSISRRCFRQLERANYSGWIGCDTCRRRRQKKACRGALLSERGVSWKATNGLRRSVVAPAVGIEGSRGCWSARIFDRCPIPR